MGGESAKPRHTLMSMLWMLFEADIERYHDQGTAETHEHGKVAPFA